MLVTQDPMPTWLNRFPELAIAGQGVDTVVLSIKNRAEFRSSV